MDVLYLLQFLAFLHAFSSYAPQYCQEAVNTVKQVSSCPITQQERDNAAKEKGCEKYSHHQNCSKDFVYHCVINEYENESLEVCAPTRFILGFCTEFNVKGGRIQDHYPAECSKFDPPCPERYISTDAYLYESCYGLVESKTSVRPYLANMTSTTSGSNNVTSINGDSTDSISFWILPVVVVILLIFIIASVWIYRRKRQSKRQRGRKRLQAARAKLFKELHYPSESTKLNPYIQTEEHEGSSEIPKDVISKSSYTDVATINRGRSIITWYKKDSETNLADQNKQYTKDFLEAFRKLDKYFVETRILKRVKEVLQKYHVAILIGPPGYGKTNTAIHLMLHSSFADWTMRKINRLSELILMDTKEKTFVLIDNIFDGYMYDEEVGKWRDSLVYQFYKSLEQRNVQLLITAKNDVMEKVWKYMDSKSNVFDAKHIIDVKDMLLTDSEKLAIFDNQISYANEELRIDKPAKNEKFRKEIVAAKGPIGFPLCAHLYACAEKNRHTGSNFFSQPMTYLRALVKYEIDDDHTPKTKTLLLLLYLSQSCPKYSSSTSTNSLDEKACQQALENFPNEYIEFDTTGLATQAKKLIPTILMQQSELFSFKHQTICKAVGNYFFVEHFKMASEAFPIETFVDQDFSTVTKKQCSEICARLIREVVENSHVLTVFSCIALKESSFAQRFCSHLRELDLYLRRQFFAATGTPSSQFKFPVTFWVSKNECFHLAMLMTEMIYENDIDRDLHFYASLFGDCCASDESLLKDASNTTLKDVKYAKDTVHACTTCDENNIFHIVAKTSKSDLHSYWTLEKLHADFQDRQPEVYKKRNKKGETPLNAAAKNKSVSRILSILTFLEFDETCTNTKDVDGHYPIHNIALALQSSTYNVLFELEMTVRVCIFIVYSANSKQQTRAKSFIDKHHFKCFQAMLDCKYKNQKEMANIIEKLLTEVRKEKTYTEDRCTVPNPKNTMERFLITVIQKSVSILEKAKFEI